MALTKNNMEFIYEKNTDPENESRIIKVRDIEKNITIDVIWNNKNVDTAFCNFIIRMACLGRGIENKK